MSDPSSSSAPAKVGGGSAMGITIGVGVPILLVIATAVIVLILVLLYLRYRAKQKVMEEYHPVPTTEVDHGVHPLPPKQQPSTVKTGGKKQLSGSSLLPYPVKLPKAARVQIGDPQPPVTFVHAAQLDSSSGTTGYAFSEPQPLSSQEFKKYELGKTGKSGGRRVHLQSGELTDSSDPESTSRSSSSERKVSGQVSPMLKRSAIIAPIDYSDQPKLPEVCFQLKYSEHANKLTIKIERVAYLPYRQDGGLVDAYVRLFFIPKLQELPQRKTSKTQTQRGTSPVFSETIVYEAMTPEEVINSTLHIEVLDFRSYGKHQILGQGDLPLIQVKFEGEVASITLPLHLPKAKENLGTVLLSLCYSPEDKKLSVIILRAKDLNKGNARETDAQAKVWITLGGDKILAKLRTRRKLQSCQPIFNEALTATVDPSQMKNVSINVSLTNESKQAMKKELGQVIVCGQACAEEFRHWNDVLASPGKQIAEWHELK